MSTIREQVAQGSDVIPTTPAQEQSTAGRRYVLVSPTLGQIIVEQLLKGKSNNIVKLEEIMMKNV